MYSLFFLTEYDFNLSHTGRVEGGCARVKQEPEEVKWYCLLRNDLLFTLCVTLNTVHFVIYACPQLINDANYELSGNYGLGNADVKEECSSHFSNHPNNEGNPTVGMRRLQNVQYSRQYIR